MAAPGSAGVSRDTRARKSGSEVSACHGICETAEFVMAGLVPAIHVFLAQQKQDVGCRHPSPPRLRRGTTVGSPSFSEGGKAGHDELDVFRSGPQVDASACPAALTSSRFDRGGTGAGNREPHEGGEVSHLLEASSVSSESTSPIWPT